MKHAAAAMTTLILMSVALPVMAQSPIQEAAKVKKERDALLVEVRDLRRENGILKAKVERLEAAKPEEAAEEEPKKEPAKVSGGWGKHKWGDPTKTFKKHHKKAIKADDKWCLKQYELLGSNGAMCGLYTPDGRLAQIIWVRTAKFVADDSEMQVYNEIGGSLTKKYGKAVENPKWISELYRDQPYMAVSMGQLELNALWETEDTLILLSHSGSDAETTVSLVYMSKALKDEMTAKMDKRNADQL